MSKLLYVLAAALAVGLVWFFALLALLEQGFGMAVTDLVRTVMLVACLGTGAFVGWRIFVSAKRSG